MPADILAWDTNFFGFIVARAKESQLDSKTVQELLVWCRNRAVRCLYFQAYSNHFPTTLILQQNGFVLMSVKLTFTKRLDSAQGGPESDSRIVPARPEHREKLLQIAANVHEGTRFYMDPGFSKESCQRLYAEWMRKILDDPSKEVLVPLNGDQPSGYITCEIDSETNMGNIGLFALAPSCRGQGLGNLLLQAGSSWFINHNINKVTVVTQASNIAAQRCYQRGGFIIEKVGYCYHKWFC